MNIDVRYKLGHIIYQYEKNDLYCPNCGTKNIWEEQGLGDYYVGTVNLCTQCESEFTIQGPIDVDVRTDSASRQILKTIFIEQTKEVNNKNDQTP